MDLHYPFVANLVNEMWEAATIVEESAERSDFKTKDYEPAFPPFTARHLRASPRPRMTFLLAAIQLLASRGQCIHRSNLRRCRLSISSPDGRGCGPSCRRWRPGRRSPGGFFTCRTLPPW